MNKLRRTAGTLALTAVLAAVGASCGGGDDDGAQSATSQQDTEDAGSSGGCLLSKDDVAAALSHLQANGGDFALNGSLEEASNEFVSTCTFSGENERGSRGAGEVGIMTDEAEAEEWISKLEASDSATSSADKSSDGISDDPETAQVFAERDAIAYGDDNEGIVELDGTFYYARFNWANEGRSGIPEVMRLLAATVAKRT